MLNDSETTEQIVSRVHAQVHELFSELGIIGTLANLHRLALDEAVSKNECNDLVMGAYRTLYLGAGMVHYRVLRETQDSTVADQAACSVLNQSGLRNIASIITDSLPISEAEPMQAVSKETGILFQSATMLDRLVRHQQFAKAKEVWLACAKGMYVEIPMIASLRNRMSKR